MQHVTLQGHERAKVKRHFLYGFRNMQEIYMYANMHLRNMHDLDLTSPGHSMSKQMLPNKSPLYDFLSSIYNKFGRICKGFQLKALENMPDLDLTSPHQSRSKTKAQNERP